MNRLLEIFLFAISAIWVLPRILGTMLAAKYCTHSPQQHAGITAEKSRQRANECPSLDIVCISHVEWHHAWQRNQHVMSRLAEKGKVLYCYPVKIGGFRVHWRRVLQSVFEIKQGRLWLVYPIVIPGARKIEIIDRINSLIQSAYIRALMRRFGMEKPILWYYFPDQISLRGKLNESACVYDIQDNYSHFAWASPDVARRERELLAKSDFVFTGTDTLREVNESFAKRIEFIPCGVEFEHFHQTRESNKPLTVPENLEDLPKPVLGYFGLIDDRLDLKMIEQLAMRHPEWNFLFVGPLYKSAQPIEPLPNIHFTGQIAYSDLPRYAQFFDVCLMPFVLNELTLAINPTKTLEYFALERPVVSSQIPDVVKFYSEVISFADGVDEWEKAIQKALQPDPERIQKAMEIAHGRSWDTITERFVARIQEAVRKDKQRASS